MFCPKRDTSPCNLCTMTLHLHITYFYFQQEEILNARGTTLLLGIRFENHEVLDVLFQYFAQIIGHFQLPMSIDLLKLIKIITADDERKLSLAIVDSTNQIRAKSKCDFKLEDIHSLVKNDLQQWEFVKDSKFIKKVSTAFL